jgi:hypothetical protein
MRTTVTLEPDVQKLLQDAADRSGRPFKQVLNGAVRAGLQHTQKTAPPFEQPVFSLGQAKVDLVKAGVLAADLEDRDTVAAAKRTHK